VRLFALLSTSAFVPSILLNNVIQTTFVPAMLRGFENEYHLNRSGSLDGKAGIIRLVDRCVGV